MRGIDLLLERRRDACGGIEYSTLPVQVDGTDRYGKGRRRKKVLV